MRSLRARRWLCAETSGRERAGRRDLARVRDGRRVRRLDLRERARGEALRRRDRLHDREERGRGRAPARARADARAPAAHGVGRAAVGVVGGSVPFVLFFEGLSRAEATQAAFIQKTLVVWVALLAVPLLRERVGVPHALAIGLLVAGQAWIAGHAGTIAFGQGEAMILAATLLWAVEVV